MYPFDHSDRGYSSHSQARLPSPPRGGSTPPGSAIQAALGRAGFSMSFRLLLCTALAAIGLLVSANADPTASSRGPNVAVDGAAVHGVTVHDAWARASAGSAVTGAVYLTLTGGDTPDSIVGVSAEVAATAEVHESFADDGVMKMRRVPLLPIPAGTAVALAPGGEHVMLIGLKRPLIAGQSFPLTMTFEHAASVTVEVKVQPLGRALPATDHGQERMN
jgi:copper(I)-binding protein